jgi:hypothetical protein
MILAREVYEVRRRVRNLSRKIDIIRNGDHAATGPSIADTSGHFTSFGDATDATGPLLGLV